MINADKSYLHIKGALLKFSLILLLVIFSTHALAHSGGTDSSGCHHDRKRGGYHCHHNDAKSPEGSREPASAGKTKKVKMKRAQLAKGKR